MADPTADFKYPSKEEDLITFLDKRWKEGVEYRAAADIKAFWNIAFYHGHQWLYEGSSRSETTLQRIPVDADDPNAPVMLTINKVASRVDRAIAEITGNSPGIECRPVSEEDADFDAAKVATRISAAEDRRMGVETLLPRLYTWVIPAGWAFTQVAWNADDGAYVGDDPEKAKNNIKKELYEGNVEGTVRPHYEVVLDPMATDSWDARWCITQSALTPAEVYEQYGLVAEKPTGLIVISDRLAGLGSERKFSQQDRIAVRQFWLRPGASRDVPEGMVFTWAGQTVLEARKSWPYKRTRRLPTIQFNYLPPQGGYFGRTPVSDLIDLQIDYNRARSVEADIASRINPKAFYQDDSIEVENISARVEWIPYMPGAAPPTPFVLDAGWMQQHETIMKRSDMEMDERMHQPEASRGGLAGTSPAAGVIAQQESARKPYAVPAKEMARALEHFGWYRLMLVRQYWREARLVRTWSRAGTLTVERFKAADVDRELDIEVRAESILPRSKASQAQIALQLMQAKAPGFDIRHFIRMIDLPGTDVFTEVYDADERQAERENQYLATKGRKAPTPPPPNAPPEEQGKFIESILKVMPWVHPRDNHAVHIETHRLHMISVEFEKYPDKVRALFEAHISQHEMIQASQMQAQQQLQQPQKPALPGQGGMPAGNGAGGIPGIEELAGMNGGPGGGMSQPGVPPGIEPDAAALAMGR